MGSCIKRSPVAEIVAVDVLTIGAGSDDTNSELDTGVSDEEGCTRLISSVKVTVPKVITVTIRTDIIAIITLFGLPFCFRLEVISIFPIF